MCEHNTCDPNDALWLPRGQYIERENTVHHSGTLAPHMYCGRCGLIRVEGEGRGRKAGFYVSLVNDLRVHRDHCRTGARLTSIDVRLICAEIRGNDLFTDPYGSSRAAQDNALVEIILTRRGDLNRAGVEEYVKYYRPKRKRRPPSN